MLGVPLGRYIDIEDSEEMLRAIRLTPEAMPIDLIVHRPGGLVLAAEQIAHALRGHPARVTIFVPHYAMSGGTLLALACDQIVMDPNAVLGPVDPQIGPFAAASILEAVARKPVEAGQRPDADAGRPGAQGAGPGEGVRQERAARRLSRGACGEDRDRPHLRPVDARLSRSRYEALADIGLPVSKELPEEAFQLMDLYPQAGRQRPSVQYVPIPYREAPSTQPTAGRPRHGPRLRER